jgi:MFS family permease
MARRMLIKGPLALLLVAAFLIQFTVPLTRVATTYRALDIGLDPNLAGVLAAAFALLPLFLVVWFGRLTDRHGVKPTMLAGAAIIFLAVLLLCLVPPSLASLLIGIAVLGVGQTLHYSGLQMVVPLVSTRPHRDAILGNYLLATSLGDALAPLLIGLSGSDEPGAIASHLYNVAVISGGALCVFASILALRLKRHSLGGRVLPPIGEIIRTPGMIAILIAGSTCGTAQDLMITYVPVLGLDRGIPAATVGVMLTIISLSSVASRAAYGFLSRRLGRNRLAVVATLVAAAGFVALAIPLPVYVSLFSLPMIGFGLGCAGTATLAILLHIAPRSARGTAMSMRQLGNRLGLFALPFGIGLVALTAGTTGTFLVLSALVAGASVLARRTATP